MESFTKQAILIGAFIIYLLMQLPFLTADPDIDIYGGRGPNTDEGLYSNQIRNYINHNNLTLNSSDSLVKTPLLSVLLYIPFKIFGTQLLVARLTILIFSLLIIFLICKGSENNFFATLLFGIVLSQFYIFHYFHYCLAEIISTTLIFFSINLLIKNFYKKSHILILFYSITAISLSYFVKIQFFYSVVIIPLYYILLMFFRLVRFKDGFRNLIYSISFLSIYCLLYYFAWASPNSELFSYTIQNQTTGRFAEINSAYEFIAHIKGTILFHFHETHMWIFSWTFYILFLTGLKLCFTSKSNKYKFSFILVLCWLLSESHKLMMTYIPSRYFISLFFAMGLMMCIVLNELMIVSQKSYKVKLIKMAIYIVVTMLLAQNVKDYIFSYQRRTYVISSIDSYLAEYQFTDRPVIGAWSSSLAWKCKAITFPVWNTYFNDADIIHKFHPRIIISEPDEKDSDKAYSSKGIKIDSFADSIKYFRVNHWDIKLLWMKK